MFVWGTKYSIFILLFYCSRGKKIYKSNCTPGTAWIVISRTSAPPELRSEVQLSATNLSSEQRQNSRKTQTNQTKEGGRCAIWRANLKWQVWQSQPSPGAAARVVERLLPCCWVRAFPSSARGLAPPGPYWNPPSLSGKSLFVLQCCHHLHWTLQTWTAAWGMTFHSGLFLFYQCTRCSRSVHRGTLNNCLFVHGFNRINQPVLSTIPFQLASCSSVYIPLPTVFRFSTRCKYF